MAPFGFSVEALESCIEKYYRKKSVIWALHTCLVRFAVPYFSFQLAHFSFASSRLQLPQLSMDTKHKDFFSSEKERQRRIRVCCSKLVRQIARLLDKFQCSFQTILFWNNSPLFHNSWNTDGFTATIRILYLRRTILTRILQKCESHSPNFLYIYKNLTSIVYLLRRIGSIHLGMSRRRYWYEDNIKVDI
jgi:hypothetical protein